MTTATLIDSLLRTAQVGSLYALMAIGLTLTFAVVRLPNFAHAELITVGAYVALVVSILWTGNPLLVLTAAFLVSALIAVLANRIVYKPLSRQRSSIYTLILSSFAVGLILRYILFLLADRYELFDRRIRVPLEIWYRDDLITLTNVFFWVVPVSIGLVISLSMLLNYTPLGREMRALADNFTLAKVIGVPVDRVHDLTWLLVGGMAGVAGALWGIYTWVNPLVGWLAILSVFAAMVLGGMTSFSGTILGAYIVAFSENTIMQFLNAWIGLDFSFKPAIPFLIIILVLLFRPQGLTEFSADLRRLYPRRRVVHAD
ncbi:MAG: branched-chain amino acid ABC transporter permease [Caldilineaceae bacterium]|nr:branched-chain amino acid ABC transporter permease [Caldilineaceae bacterium]